MLGNCKTQTTLGRAAARPSSRAESFNCRIVRFASFEFLPLLSFLFLFLAASNENFASVSRMPHTSIVIRTAELCMLSKHLSELFCLYLPVERQSAIPPETVHGGRPEHDTQNVDDVFRDTWIFLAASLAVLGSGRRCRCFRLREPLQAAKKKSRTRRRRRRRRRRRKKEEEDEEEHFDRSLSETSEQADRSRTFTHVPPDGAPCPRMR